MRLVWTVKLCLHSFDWIWLPVICIIGFGDIIGSQFPQGKLGGVHETWTLFDPWESLSAFSGFGFDLFGYLILVESQNVCPFLVWFISLTIMTIRFVDIVALSELLTLKGRIIFHCVSTTVCLWSGLPWTLRLLLFVGHCESCCCDYDCRSMHFFSPFPHTFWVHSMN